jgi:nitroreductase
MINDIYQTRYEAHQKRKAEMLMSNYGTANFKRYKDKEKQLFFEILDNRCSQRIYNKEDIELGELSNIFKAIDKTPNSCGRKGIMTRIINCREDKEILGGLLVGGAGWVHRANTIIMLLADMTAYKNPIEKDFMPYLDAGAIIQSVYLSSEVQNIGCCFVNPHIREENRKFFKERFNIGDNLFCGILSLGKYDFKNSHNCIKYVPNFKTE